MMAALIVACGGSAFSSSDGADLDAAIDGAVEGGHVADGGGGLDTGTTDDASTTDDSGASADGEARDSGGQDAGGAHDAATDSGVHEDASSADADTCTGVGECDTTHPCPTSGVGHVTCCPALAMLGSAARCGTCSTGLCPE
jgi:hypothetical protein